MATLMAPAPAPIPAPAPAPAKVGRVGPSPLRRLVTYAVLAAVTGLFVAPIIVMIVGAFKSEDRVLPEAGGLTAFVPTQTENNFADVFDRVDFARFMINSLAISILVVALGLVANSLAAYAFARLRWRGRDAVFTLVVALVIIPFEAIAVPLFYMMSSYTDTYFIQIAPFIADAFSIYLFYTFFVGLPKQLEEAARVDGAGPWRTFFKIMLPMSKPVFASVTILRFLYIWAMFLWPVMVTTGPEVRPLPRAIAVFQGTPPTQWGDILAFGTMMVAPVLIVFLVFQRWFVQSVASSGLKG
jgi:multiple sugar transport system permease protein